MRAVAIIPSRYNSNRLPGKPLLDIQGKSLIERVFHQCQKCKEISRTIVSTDDERIAFHVKSFGGEVIMTSSDHKTGTDRCGEVINKIEDQYDIILNVQGDQPYISPDDIKNLIYHFDDQDIDIATLCEQIKDYDEYSDLDVPKVAFDDKNTATEFTREGDLNKEEFDKGILYKHIGIYAFRNKILSDIVKINMSESEKLHNLEQLRWMDNNYKIHLLISSNKNVSIDKQEDINKIKTFDVKNS